MKCAISLLLIGLIAAPLPRAWAADDPAAPSDEVKKLIAQLGNDDFATREAASGKLMGIGKPALPALKLASKHPDPEIAGRAQALIRRIEIRPVPGMDPAFLNGNVAMAGRMGISVVNGKQVLEVAEGGRQVTITMGGEDIQMSVTGWVDGQEVTEEYAARDADQLKAENPEAYALYQRWTRQLGGANFAFNGRIGARVGNIQFQPPPPDELDLLRGRLEKQMREGHFKETQHDDVIKELDKLVEARTDRQPNKGMEKYTEACDAFRKTLEQNKLDPGELLPPPAATRLGVSIAGDTGRLVVTQVSEKSRAERIGLKPGDVVQKVDGKDIGTVAELRKAVSTKAKGLVVEISRDGDNVKLEEKDDAKEQPAK